MTTEYGRLRIGSLPSWAVPRPRMEAILLKGLEPPYVGSYSVGMAWSSKGSSESLMAGFFSEK